MTTEPTVEELAGNVFARRIKMQRLDLETSTAIVKGAVALAEARPDYTYDLPDAPGCLYTEGGEDGKGCLFGQSAAEAGLSRGQLRELEFIEVQAILHAETPGRCEAGWVQTHQDDGIRWGEAIKPLREALEKEGVL